MRHLSSMLCASVVALAALTAGAAFAAAGVGKSSTFKLGPTDTDAGCTDQSGIISTAADGTKSCTTPPMACATPVSYGRTADRRIDTNDVAAVMACFDACGKIGLGTDGNKICTTRQAASSGGDPHAIVPGPERRPVSTGSRSSLPH